MPNALIIVYIVVFIVMTFITYQSLKAFDFSKILRRNKTRELYFLMYIISLICGFLLAEGMYVILERILSFIKK